MLKMKVAVVLYWRRVKELIGDRTVLLRPFTIVAAWTNTEAKATIFPLFGHTWQKRKKKAKISIWQSVSNDHIMIKTNVIYLSILFTSSLHNLQFYYHQQYNRSTIMNCKLESEYHIQAFPVSHNRFNQLKTINCKPACRFLGTCTSVNLTGSKRNIIRPTMYYCSTLQIIVVWFFTLCFLHTV